MSIYIKIFLSIVVIAGVISIGMMIQLLTQVEEPQHIYKIELQSQNCQPNRIWYSDEKVSDLTFSSAFKFTDLKTKETVFVTGNIIVTVMNPLNKKP